MCLCHCAASLREYQPRSASAGFLSPGTFKKSQTFQKIIILFLYFWCSSLRSGQEPTISSTWASSKGLRSGCVFPSLMVISLFCSGYMFSSCPLFLVLYSVAECFESLGFPFALLAGHSIYCILLRRFVQGNASLIHFLWVASVMRPCNVYLCGFRCSKKE